MIEIGGSHGGEYDSIQVDGIVSLAGTLDVVLWDFGDGMFTPALGSTFEIVSASQGLSGTFDEAVLPPLSEGLAWSLDYDVVGGSVLLNVIPEPSSFLLLVLGVSAIVRRRST